MLPPTIFDCPHTTRSVTPPPLSHFLTPAPAPLPPAALRSFPRDHHRKRASSGAESEWMGDGLQRVDVCGGGGSGAKSEWGGTDYREWIGRRCGKGLMTLSVPWLDVDTPLPQVDTAVDDVISVVLSLPSARHHPSTLTPYCLSWFRPCLRSTRPWTTLSIWCSHAKWEDRRTSSSAQTWGYK